MTAIKTESLVLRTRRYSESSLIAVLLTPQHGRMDVLAKGCRREKSPLFGHLDVYQHEDVLVLERAQSSLDLLTEAAFVDEHAGLRFSPPAFAAAGFLADLAADVCQPRDPQPRLFSVMTGAFGLLSRLGDPAARAGLAEALPFSPAEKGILIGRTLKLSILDALGWLGFGLELRNCAACGTTAEPPLWISWKQGGLVCRNCKNSARDAALISPAALSALRERGPGGEQFELALPERERRRWLRYLVDYSQYVIGKRLRGGKVLLQIL